MSLQELKDAVSRAGVDAPVRWMDVTGSTNAEAADWATEGAPEFALVAAGHQIAGRGRMGRVWQSEPGGSLIFSFVLRPIVEPGSSGLITLAAGAALVEAARLQIGPGVSCKWPNDLMLDGAKAGGILCESSVENGSLRFVVVGVGVNLKAPDGIPGAVGLGDGVDAMRLLSDFLSQFRGLYAAMSGRGVIDAWSAVSATLGRDVEARLTDGGSVLGRAAGVDPRGALVLHTDEGVTVLESGDVIHLR
jgi:BirA family transcriptional regulator, biotin operon repressor / biotin---[acetyl-CoA-carboxylase] ligase